MKNKWAFISGLVLGICGEKINIIGKTVEIDIKENKFKTYYNMLSHWLYLKNKNINLGTYFEKYSRVVIYGMGELGERLYEELRNTDIKIIYGIDNSNSSIQGDFPVYSLSDIQNKEVPDIIVITAVSDYESIKKDVEKIYSCDIVSLEDVVFSI